MFPALSVLPEFPGVSGLGNGRQGDTVISGIRVARRFSQRFPAGDSHSIVNGSEFGNEDC